MLPLKSQWDPLHHTGILIKFISPLLISPMWPKCQYYYENLSNHRLQLCRHLQPVQLIEWWAPKKGHCCNLILKCCRSKTVRGWIGTLTGTQTYKYGNNIEGKIHKNYWEWESYGVTNGSQTLFWHRASPAQRQDKVYLFNSPSSIYWRDQENWCSITGIFYLGV